MAKPKDSKHFLQQKLWLGISNLLKEPSSQDPDQPTNYWYSENLNVRNDPFALTLNLATVKESGGTVVDFVKWADITPASLTTYLYGDAGNIYSRTTAGMWSLLHTSAASHGNGLQYFYGDDYLYYINDTNIGRYGPLAGTPTFSDDFLTAQGGVPQNTNSLSLVAASSQYATAANSASLDITGDLTLEAAFYLNSFPAVGSSMVLLGKWDESGALRSYIMDIYGVSGFFGTGENGALTISSNTTEVPIDSVCTGTATSYVLSATNATFAVGQAILIHQSQGTNAGQNERNIISGYTAGTITLQTPLLGTYTTGAQVRILRQYTNVTINSGVTYTAKAWNGTTGGIIGFLLNGTLSCVGNIVADGCGYRGAPGNSTQQQTGKRGEGTLGNDLARTTANQGNGGGGGQGGAVDGSGPTGGGGGGGNSTSGGSGKSYNGGTGGQGGNAVGSADATTAIFGGGGGEDGTRNNTDTIGATSGSGGGIVFISGVTITVTGTVSSNGKGPVLSGGTGAAGVVLLKAQTLTLGTSLVTATGIVSSYGGSGNGYCVTNYLISYTGTTTPTLNAIQDNTLVTTTTYQARLGISNDGTAFEYTTKNLPTLTTGQWNRLSISWASASSLSTFYWNANSLGTITGTKTAISNNLSLLYVGAKKGVSVVGSFTDGLVDDLRIWSAVQSALNIYLRNNIQLTGNEGGLAAYYKVNASASDGGPNANTLTLVNTPSYFVNVPFVDPSTRLDIDTSFVTIGSTYTVPTAISEATTDQLPFTPVNDPQKSMDINVSAKGTGNWTLTIHDQTNRVIATQTILNANMATSGYQEFIWTTPWRIVIGKNYHAHITVSTGTSSVVTSSLNVLQSAGAATGDFHTYFGFLVSDTLFHPAIRWLNFLAIGNERYIAKWDGAFYAPNLIAFPQGTHVRCYGPWGIYLAIGTWQEASTATPNVYDFATGKIYFWDGISLTYNFSIDVPEGQINAIFGMDANLYYYAGWHGDLMQYTGGWANQSGSFNGTKIKRLPYLKQQDYMEVYPQAMCNYQGLLYMGVAANTNSTTLPQGLYSWGALYPQYPQTLSFDHLISTGNKGGSVRIGCVYPVQQKLFVSWKDGLSYGVDVIDPTAGVYHTSGLIQPNILDGGDMWRQNLLLKVRADHVKLNTGEGVTVGYKLDRESTFETSNSVTDTLKRFTTNTLSNGRMNEYQLQVQLTGTGSSTPTLLALSAGQDNLTEETAF